jgi:hypothetical protein
VAGSEARDRAPRDDVPVGPPDADASGGPHSTRPTPGRPVWTREEPRAGARGFNKGLLVVLGISFLFLVAIVLYAASLAGRNDTNVTAPLSQPTAGREAAQGGAGTGAATRVESRPPQSVGSGENAAPGGPQSVPANPDTPARGTGSPPGAR